jgi:excinuclease UvrABC ATPase subunit
VDRFLAEVESGEDEAFGDFGSPDFSKILLEPERRIWEIGDLHLELAKLAISAHELQAKRNRTQLLSAWNEYPDAKLVIDPRLQEMRIWGSRLPQSVQKTLSERIKHLPLQALTKSAQRQFGSHILENSSAAMALSSELERGLAIGGGVACLYTHGREFFLAESAVELKKGVVGPARLSPSNLSRLSPAGRCPSCKGFGLKRSTDLSLVRSGKGPFEQFEALHPQAQAILKGRWRSDAVPFFKRLDAEGLGAVLTKETFLFGYWTRPGHGSFIKNSKSDPKEVTSWLRWDGLFALIWDELARSKDKIWTSKIIGSESLTFCPVCDGTGHRELCRIVPLLGRSVFDWVKSFV